MLGNEVQKFRLVPYCRSLIRVALLPAHVGRCSGRQRRRRSARSSERPAGVRPARARFIAPAPARGRRGTRRGEARAPRRGSGSCSGVEARQRRGRSRCARLPRWRRQPKSFSTSRSRLTLRCWTPRWPPSTAAATRRRRVLCRRRAFERDRAFLALLLSRRAATRRLTPACARRPQRVAAERVMLQLQEHPDMWTRVDAILETSSNPNSKFLALQARAPPSTRQRVQPPPRAAAWARHRGRHAPIAAAAAASKAAGTRLVSATRRVAAPRGRAASYCRLRRAPGSDAHAALARSGAPGRRAALPRSVRSQTPVRADVESLR